MKEKISRNSLWSRQTVGRDGIRILVHLSNNKQQVNVIAERLGWDHMKVRRWIAALEAILPIQSDGGSCRHDPCRFWIDKKDLRRVFGL